MSSCNSSDQTAALTDGGNLPRLSQTRLATIFARAAVGLSEISLEGRFQHVNDELCRILGRPREELLAMEVPAVTHPEDIERSLAALKHLIETGESISLDKRYVRPDGSLIYANSALTRIEDENGLPCSVLAVTVDLTDRKLRELNAAFLADLHADFTRLSHPDEIMRETANKISRHLKVSGVTFIDISEDERNKFIIHHQHSEALSCTSASQRLADSMSEPYVAQLRSGQTIAINAIQSDPRTEPFAESYQRHGVRSLIHAPFHSDGRWCFLLAIEHNAPREWRADEIDLARELAAHICLRLERAHADEVRRVLHDQLETELADMHRLQETSSRLIAESNVNALLDEILDAAVTFGRADAGTMQVLDDETGQFILLATRGLNSEIVMHLASHRPDDNTTCGEVIRTGQRIIIPNFDASKSSAELHKQAGIAACQSTPLISRSGRLLGVMSTHWRNPHHPPKRELRLLDLLARQAADLIERHLSEAALRKSEQNLRALSRSLEERVKQRTAELQDQAARLRDLAAELASTEQRERKRLAALLHDDLQQVLVAAAMQIQMIGRRIHDMDTVRATEEAVGWLRDAADTARDLTRQLRPPALYEDGLVAALTWLSLEMKKRYSLQVTIDASEDPARLVNDDIKALLFECVRELLFNVAKYAGVEMATVTLRGDHEHLSLTVTDSGLGFDQTDITRERQQGGFGLFSVRERLAALGGKMKISSSPGKGTSIELNLPLRDDQTEALPLVHKKKTRVTRTETKGDEETFPSVDQRLRVLVADDHALVREGIANILNSDQRLVVVSSASDGFTAIEAVEKHRPDIILVDINMPRMNGIEAIREIRRRWPDTIIIGLSVQNDEATAQSVRAAGASAFLSKSGDSDQMIRTILRLAGRIN